MWVITLSVNRGIKYNLEVLGKYKNQEKGGIKF